MVGVPQRLPSNMCTYNLHILVCRIQKQVMARGMPSKELEFWIERVVQQDMKKWLRCTYVCMHAYACYFKLHVCLPSTAGTVVR